MMEIIMFFAGIAAGYLMYGIITAYNRYKSIKELDSVIEEKLQSLREKIIPSRIEELDGMLFLYNDNTNEFLGQGKDLAELEKCVKERYPDKLFNVPQSILNKYQREDNA